MLRIVLVGIGVLVLVAGLWVLDLLADAGAFREIEPHFAGSCRRVTGAMGAEDLTLHPGRRVAFVSATDRRAREAGRPVPGGIHAYRLDRPEAGLENLTPEAGIDFQPHGISLWRGPDGREVLFVVNHPAPGSGAPAHAIEVFDVAGERLSHRRRIADPQALVMPNDLVAVGPDRFYLTNTHAHPPGWRQTLETYLRLADARVVYFDGERFRTALDGLLFPNGINVAAEGRRLVVASSTGRSLQVYERDPEDESLAFLREIPLGSGPDNVEVDPEGALWIAAHPNLLAVGAHGADPARRSPSQVLRVDLADDAVREVYLDEGDEISGSSVAAVLGDRLLIGQIFDDGILDCRMDPRPADAADPG